MPDVTQIEWITGKKKTAHGSSFSMVLLTTCCILVHFWLQLINRFAVFDQHFFGWDVDSRQQGGIVCFGHSRHEIDYIGWSSLDAAMLFRRLK